MKIKIILVAITALVIVPLIWFWPEIAVFTGGNAQYTERDTIRYALLTDDIIKNCPRISSKYIINYASVDGPSIYEVSAITFEGTRDVNTLRGYLSSLGLIRDRADESGEYWKPEHGDKTVILSEIEEPQTVIMQVLY